ncbi:hypothetical protein CspHIS471_0500010 [Cutaneotrichosporon sp. HIS471]|nr:hypothetical protein CspHIS471_0500010 [Cutaneotrichosporon sp. HIS471]
MGSNQSTPLPPVRTPTSSLISSILKRYPLSAAELMRLPHPHVVPADTDTDDMRVPDEEAKSIVKIFLTQHCDPDTNSVEIKIVPRDLCALLVAVEDSCGLRHLALDDNGRTTLERTHLSDFDRRSTVHGEAQAQSELVSHLKAFLCAICPLWNCGSMSPSVKSQFQLAYAGRRKAYADFGVAGQENQGLARYLGAVVEAKRFSRLPDVVIFALVQAWKDDVAFYATFSRTTGNLEFGREDFEHISPVLQNALYFLLEVATYSWAAYTWFGVLTNCLAWCPVHLTTDDGALVLHYGLPAGSLRTGDLVWHPTQDHGDLDAPAKRARPDYTVRRPSVQSPPPDPPVSHAASSPPAPAVPPSTSQPPTPSSTLTAQAFRSDYSLYGLLMLAALGVTGQNPLLTLGYDTVDGAVVSPAEPLGPWRRSARSANR